LSVNRLINISALSEDEQDFLVNLGIQSVLCDMLRDRILVSYPRAIAHGEHAWGIGRR
jgi:predicted glycosyl hydrolase (DUF1957 family)